jgi:hypothetical protein
MMTMGRRGTVTQSASRRCVQSYRWKQPSSPASSGSITCWRSLGHHVSGSSHEANWSVGTTGASAARRESRAANALFPAPPGPSTATKRTDAGRDKTSATRVSNLIAVADVPLRWPSSLDTDADCQLQSVGFGSARHRDADRCWRRSVRGTKSPWPQRCATRRAGQPRYGGAPFAPRALPTTLIDRLRRIPKRRSGRSRAAAVGGSALRRRPRTPAFAGQSAELVHDIAPAAELIARLVTETVEALRRASDLANPFDRPELSDRATDR